MLSLSPMAGSAAHQAVIAAFDFGFMGGSMGIAVGEAVLAAAQARGLAGGGADRRAGFGRRPHAGGHAVVDADAAHDHRCRHGQGGRPALHRAADRPDDRRRLRLVRDARRRHPCRAGRGHRLRRRAGYRGDHPREIAGGLSARRISSGARHGRPGRAARANCATRSARLLGLLRRQRRWRCQRRPLPRSHDCRSQRHRAGAPDAPAPEADRPVARPRSSGCSRRSAIRRTRLPPVIHVAGTNGKGSTVATLRACLEAGGL